MENSNVLIHRLYGAVRIEENIYRTKTTLKEIKDEGNKPYDYQITKVDLIVSVPSAGNARTYNTPVI